MKTAPAVPRLFLLSPANCAGKRAQMLLNGTARFELAQRLRAGEPVTLGEICAFLSSLYFRGKLAYATKFGDAPRGWDGALVLAPGLGLVPAGRIITITDLEAMAGVPVDHEEPRFVEPLLRDARLLAKALGRAGRVVLLGSVATDKYVRPLGEAFGDRLLFPPTFVGRGDMSRGGLLLRCARSGTRLDYAPVLGATRSGPRPPKLTKLTRVRVME